MGDDPAAAQDQEIGDRLAEIGPLGDRQHVVAALGGGDGDEILVVQARRGDEHRPRDGDLVERELAHDAARRIGHRRQPLGQFDARARTSMARARRPITTSKTLTCSSSMAPAVLTKRSVRRDRICARSLAEPRIIVVSRSRNSAFTELMHAIPFHATPGSYAGEE